MKKKYLNNVIEFSKKIKVTVTVMTISLLVVDKTHSAPLLVNFLQGKETEISNEGGKGASPNEAVQRTILTKCAVSGCHNSISSQGRINFQTTTNIDVYRNRIRARAIDAAGTISQMPQPPNPALSKADKKIILGWLNEKSGGK
jgi:hypothetical protein